MFESAVNDRAQDFRLEKEIPEAGAVDGDVRALHFLLRGAVRRSAGIADDLSLE